MRSKDILPPLNKPPLPAGMKVVPNNIELSQGGFSKNKGQASFYSNFNGSQFN